MSRCRMVTSSGKQCSRNAEPGALGFCWQHAVVTKTAKREKWKSRIEGATLAIAASEVLVDVVKLAVEQLPEFFGGGGGEQLDAKSAIEREVGANLWGTHPVSFVPGSRVDWVTLHEILQMRNELDKGGVAKVAEIDARFNAWFEGLAEYHQKLLLGAILEA